MSDTEEVAVIPAVYERIRDYLNLGLIVDTEVWPAVMSGGWYLVFKTKNVAGHFILASRTTKQPREFRTLDALARVLRDLGYKVNGFRVL